MTLLPIARYHQGTHSPEKLRLTCLEACDALSKHASYLRQVLEVSQPQFESVYLVVGNSVGSANQDRKLNVDRSPTGLPEPSLDKFELTQDQSAQVLKAEMEDIFGSGAC
jgi:hypothetical protein